MDIYTGVRTQTGTCAPPPPPARPCRPARLPAPHISVTLPPPPPLAGCPARASSHPPAGHPGGRGQGAGGRVFVFVPCSTKQPRTRPCCAGKAARPAVRQVPPGSPRLAPQAASTHKLHIHIHNLSRNIRDTQLHRSRAGNRRSTDGNRRSTAGNRRCSKALLGPFHSHHAPPPPPGCPLLSHAQTAAREMPRG